MDNNYRKILRSFQSQNVTQKIFIRLISVDMLISKKRDFLYKIQLCCFKIFAHLIRKIETQLKVSEKKKPFVKNLDRKIKSQHKKKLSNLSKYSIFVIFFSRHLATFFILLKSKIHCQIFNQLRKNYEKELLYSILAVYYKTT